jgi:3,4-dihydroxy 2-butanone 4-phosphate synthase/GTP cyclohydrolase II
VTLDLALETLDRGSVVLLHDEQRPQGPAHLVALGELVSARSLQRLTRLAGHGLVALALDRTRLEELELPPPRVRSGVDGLSVSASIDAAEYRAKGGSTTARAHTIRIASAAETRPEQVIVPGYVPVAAADAGGVLVRQGPAEGAIELARASGATPSAAVATVRTARGAPLAAARALRERSLQSVAHVGMGALLARADAARRHEQVTCLLPTRFGNAVTLASDPYPDGTIVLALAFGERDATAKVHVHVGCLLSDALGSTLCACGAQLRATLAELGSARTGVLVYVKRPTDAGLSCAAVDCARDAPRVAAAIRRLGLERAILRAGQPELAARLRELQLSWI